MALPGRRGQGSQLTALPDGPDLNILAVRRVERHIDECGPLHVRRGISLHRLAKVKELRKLRVRIPAPKEIAIARRRLGNLRRLTVDDVLRKGLDPLARKGHNADMHRPLSRERHVAGHRIGVEVNQATVGQRPALEVIALAHGIGGLRNVLAVVHRRRLGLRAVGLIERHRVLFGRKDRIEHDRPLALRNDLIEVEQGAVLVGPAAKRVTVLVAHLGLDGLLPNRHVSLIRERIANVEKHLTLPGDDLFPHGGKCGVGSKARERGHNRAVLVLPTREHVAFAGRRRQLAHGPAAVDVHVLHRSALARIKRKRHERVVVHHGERHARVAVLVDRDLLVHHPAAGNVVRRAGYLPKIDQLVLIAVQVVLGQKHRVELHRIGHARIWLDAGLGLRARLARGDARTAVCNLKPDPVSACDLDARKRRRAPEDDLVPVRVLAQTNHNAGHRARVVRAHRDVAGWHREGGHALLAGGEDLLGAVRQGERPVVNLPGRSLLLPIGRGVRGGLFVVGRVQLDRLALGRLEGRRLRLSTVSRHSMSRRLAQHELVVHDVHGP